MSVRCGQVHLRQNPTHTAAPVLNEDGSVPMDGSGDFEVISRRGRPRGPRAPRRMTRPRISQPVDAPLPPAPPPSLPLAMSLGADPVNSVQYAENARGPPAVMSGFPGSDETGRVDGRIFPPLPPAFGADFAASQRTLHGNRFAASSSSGFQLMADNATPRDDGTTACASSPSMFVPVRRVMWDSSVVVDDDDRPCRSYSPSTFDQRPLSSAVASVQSRAYVAAPTSAFDEYGVVDPVSPPMPEPERALCGDLPLDLTAKSTADDPGPTGPETGSRSPDDVTAYRPRRHYETWKQCSRPRSGEPASSERNDGDVSSAGGGVQREVGVAYTRPEPEIGVERATVDEPTQSAAPPAKRSRLSTDDEGRASEVATGSPAGGTDDIVGGGRYQCCHCEIEFFGSRVLHAMHMTFHGPVDPFQCSQCGARTANRVEFFLHLARVAHS